MGKDRQVEAWFLDEVDTVRRVPSLTPEELSYPVGSVMSHLALLDWIDGGYKFLLDPPMI